MLDNPDWFHNSEHDHVVGLADELTKKLRQEFNVSDLTVDIGYEERVGYHCRIHQVVPTLICRVSDRARDLLSTWTPYRLEVQCID